LAVFLYYNNYIDNVTSHKDYLFFTFTSYVLFENSNSQNLKSGFLNAKDSSAKISNCSFNFFQNSIDPLIQSLILFEQTSHNITFSLENSKFVGFYSTSNGTV